tara:strand:+ start:7120 stop:8199 length:1080 start_codon:yes stop_codon:yes gene_type:complete
MFEKIKERIFPFIITLSALSVSASAAFYSISGLSKLFAGAEFAVIIMASSLEISKLVIASLLYQYRKTLPKILKYYLSTACVILILITSMGIYGFLSSAYQETANKVGKVESQILLIETKRDNINNQLITYNSEKENINQALADLRKGLANNVIQYKDKETGEIITTTSRSTRKSLEKQLTQSLLRQDNINSKVDDLNQKIFDYETEIIDIKTNDDVAAELGPLKYLSGLTGVAMDKIINYLLLTIVFVFDPLAIALVVAANYAFEKLKEKYKVNLYGETVENIPPPEPENKDNFEVFEEKIDTIPPKEDLDEKVDILENKIKSTPKVKKRGPQGLSALKSQLSDLKKKKDDDDLQKTY